MKRILNQNITSQSQHLYKKKLFFWSIFLRLQIYRNWFEDVYSWCEGRFLEFDPHAPPFHFFTLSHISPPLHPSARSPFPPPLHPSPISAPHFLAIPTIARRSGIKDVAPCSQRPPPLPLPINSRHRCAHVPLIKLKLASLNRS